jgi:hypothetical protein
MPTVYYTDGTFKKYKRYEDILEDPYLNLDSDLFVEKLEEDKNKMYCCNASYFERIYNPLIFTFEECVEKGKVLEKVKIEEIKERINKTNSINICGLMEYIDLKYSFTFNYYPMIDKNIISELEGMFPNVTKIILSNNKLKESDINFKKFKKCEVLYLKNNLFFTITSDICNLKNLRRLKITNLNNYIKNEEFIIPSYINKLKNLEVLNLSNNNIKTIPSEIGELSKLRKLDLSCTKILELPKEIGNLINLTEILLIRTSCKIPKEIGKLNKLIKIKANGYEQFTSKTNFYVHGNKFCNLPIELWNCEKLIELHIDEFEPLHENSKKLRKLKKNIRIFDHSENYFLEYAYHFCNGSYYKDFDIFGPNLEFIDDDDD